MLDLIIGIVVLLFVALGLREGIIKSLGSVIAVFVALFLATGVINFLARSEPRFADPSFLAATIIFLVVWGLAFILIDLVLTLLFKKLITVIVLGPVDKVGGMIIGGFKGALICGIVLQLALAFPFSDATKFEIKHARFSQWAIALYQKAYPYAEKIAPKVSEFMRNNLVEKIGQKENLVETVNQPGNYPGRFMQNVEKYETIKITQKEQIKKLLKEQKLLNNAPERKLEDLLK